MRRAGRLAAGPAWLSRYPGKNPVRGYSRWFGVDLVCAVVELRLLGVAVSAAYESQLRRNAMKAPSSRVLAPDLTIDDARLDSDDDFAFIAGFTEGGQPFGVPWDDESVPLAATGAGV